MARRRFASSGGPARTAQTPAFGRGGSRLAQSPAANTKRWLRLRSAASTRTQPASSQASPEAARNGAATTPVAQSTAATAMLSPSASRTAPAVAPVARRPACSLTPASASAAAMRRRARGGASGSSVSQTRCTAARVPGRRRSAIASSTPPRAAADHGNRPVRGQPRGERRLKSRQELPDRLHRHALRPRRDSWHPAHVKGKQVKSVFGAVAQPHAPAIEVETDRVRHDQPRTGRGCERCEGNARRPRRVVAADHARAASRCRVRPARARSPSLAAHGSGAARGAAAPRHGRGRRRAAAVP